MNRIFDRKIILEDGTEFYGYGFGARRNALVELVFNTSMVGYQEILSDPSYTGQAVVMTYPLIGNYGMCADDYETDRPTISAMVVREFNSHPSNFRAQKTLENVMLEYNIVGIAGVDTRRLTRHIRDEGTCKALLVDAEVPNIVGVAEMKSHSLPTDQVSRVSVKEPCFSPAEYKKYHVAAIDCGMKQNIVRRLNSWGCDVTVFPWNTTAEEIEAVSPDGVFLSNGPGDPEDVPEVTATVKQLIGKLPIFGICLGHQLTALAMGGETMKLKYGHRGGNQPVTRLSDGRCFITSQNHGYAVVSDSMQGKAALSFVNANDGSCEGLDYPDKRCFTVQFHPEAACGPQDTGFLFDRFIAMMGGKGHA